MHGMINKMAFMKTGSKKILLEEITSFLLFISEQNVHVRHDVLDKKLRSTGPGQIYN